MARAAQNVFFAAPMRYTPWDDPRFLARAGLAPTQELDRADLVVAGRARFFGPKVAAAGKLNILWTQEPYFDTSPDPVITCHGAPVHVFNLYNRNVYLDNFRAAPGRTFWSYGADAEICFVFDPARFAARKTVILAACHPGTTLNMRGEEIGLFHYRAALSLALHARGRTTIHGKNWPDGIAAGDSSKGNWWADKPALMAHAAFNLCMENTCFAHFVTEKIWQSIAAGCLPIYYGPDHIYDDFPPDSFVDMRQLGNVETLWALLQDMSAQDYCDRMQALTALYNRTIREDLAVRSHHKTEDRILALLATHR